jgi:hypothetical protein
LSRSGSLDAAIGERKAADLRRMLAPLAVERMAGEVIPSTATIAWPPTVRECILLEERLGPVSPSGLML